jgi:hypothetical protein
MSARFTANFAVLLLGAGLIVTTFAFSPAGTASWVCVGVGGTSILVALYSFAMRHQGVYQRIADVLICLLGAWAIVAARVMSYSGRWLEFGAGAGLAALGALGLVVREARLGSGLQVGESRIGPDQLARLSAIQHDAAAKP